MHALKSLGLDAIGVGVIVSIVWLVGAARSRQSRAMTPQRQAGDEACLPRWDCPICGYDNIRDVSLRYAICPCCGNQFGYDDHAKSHAELRQEWIAVGCPWWSCFTSRPTGWSAGVQLLRRASRSATFAADTARLD